MVIMGCILRICIQLNIFNFPLSALLVRRRHICRTVIYSEERIAYEFLLQEEEKELRLLLQDLRLLQGGACPYSVEWVNFLLVFCVLVF